MNDETDTGAVAPGDGVLYEVTNTHGHETLKPGDRVRMVETPHRVNFLLRTVDDTLHFIYGKCDQYVHLRPVKE